jgi:hypothetical protein
MKKADDERGDYLYPDLFGQPAEKTVIKELREK